MKTVMLPYRLVIGLFMSILLIAILTKLIWLIFIIPVLIFIWAGLQQPRLLFFLLLFLIPFSMEFQLTATLGSDLPDEPLMWLLTPLTLLMAWKEREPLRFFFRSAIGKVLVLSLCWTLVTVITSTSPLLSLKFILAKFWFIIPFTLGALVFLRDERSQWLAARVMLAGLVCTVLVILVRHGLNGFAFAAVNDMTWPFYRNHVNYAAMIVLLLPAAWAWHRSKKTFFSALIFSLLIVALMLSYSRGAWLAIPVALIGIYAVRRKMIITLSVIVVFLFLFLGIWLVSDNRYMAFRPNYERTIYHGNFDEHMIATYAMKDLSTVERFYRWVAAWGMAKEKWLTGFGPNTFYPTYKHYQVSEFRTYVSDNPEHSTVHNYFLLLLSEQGVPGLLLFVLLFFLMLHAVQQLYQNPAIHQRGMALVITAMLVTTAVLIFLSDLLETDKVGSLFYLCAGLLMNQKNRSTLHIHNIPEGIAQQVERENK